MANTAEIDRFSPLEWVYVAPNPTAAPKTLELFLCLVPTVQKHLIDNIPSIVYFGAFGAVMTVNKLKSSDLMNGIVTHDEQSSTPFVIQRPGFYMKNPFSYPNTVVWYTNISALGFGKPVTFEVPMPVELQDQQHPIYFQNDRYYYGVPTDADQIKLLTELHSHNINIASPFLPEGCDLEFSPFSIITQTNYKRQFFIILKVVNRQTGIIDYYDFTNWFNTLYQDAEIKGFNNRTEVVAGSKLLICNGIGNQLPVHYQPYEKVSITIATAPLKLTNEALLGYDQSYPVQFLPLHPEVKNNLLTYFDLQSKVPHRFYKESFLNYYDILADTMSPLEDEHPLNISDREFHVFLITKPFEHVNPPSWVRSSSELSHKKRAAFAKYIFGDLVTIIFLLHSACYVHGQIGHQCLVTNSKMPDVILKHIVQSSTTYEYYMLNFTHAQCFRGQETVDMTASFERCQNALANVKLVPDYYCPKVIEYMLAKAWAEAESPGVDMSAYPPLNLQYSPEEAKKYDSLCCGILLFQLITLLPPAEVFKKYVAASGIASAVPDQYKSYEYIFSWMDHVNDMLQYVKTDLLQNNDDYDLALDLLKSILVKDSTQRISIEQILSHEWVQSLHKLPVGYPSRESIFAKEQNQQTSTGGKRSRTTK